MDETCRFKFWWYRWIEVNSGCRWFVLEVPELQLQRQQAQVRHERCLEC